MQIQPYLFFDGRCDDAIAFYKKTLKAEVVMLMRFKDGGVLGLLVVQPLTGGRRQRCQHHDPYGECEHQQHQSASRGRQYRTEDFEACGQRCEHHHAVYEQGMGGQSENRRQGWLPGWRLRPSLSYTWRA